MGLHTPFTSDALSPALRSGASNTRYQLAGSQVGPYSPAPKRAGAQGYTGPFQPLVDVGRFLLVRFLV